MKVAVVGATGLVGNVMRQVLVESKFPVTEFMPVASARSVGKMIEYAGKEYPIQVKVKEAGSQGLTATQQFTVRVADFKNPLDELVATLQEQGATVERKGQLAGDPFVGNGHLLNIDGQHVRVYQYENEAAAQGDAKQILPDAKTWFGKPKKWQDTIRLFRRDRLLAQYTGDDAELIARLSGHMGTPFAIGKAESSSLPPTKPVPPVAVNTPEKVYAERMLDLYQNKKLFDGKQYRALRHVYVDRFEKQHQDEIKLALGEDYQKMT